MPVVPRFNELITPRQKQKARPVLRQLPLPLSSGAVAPAINGNGVLLLVRTSSPAKISILRNEPNVRSYSADSRFRTVLAQGQRTSVLPAFHIRVLGRRSNHPFRHLRHVSLVDRQTRDFDRYGGIS